MFLLYTPASVPLNLSHWLFWAVFPGTQICIKIPDIIEGLAQSQSAHITCLYNKTTKVTLSLDTPRFGYILLVLL